MKFDWDANKAEINLAEHQVSFEEAARVFRDVWSIQEYDDSHSNVGERRFTIIGLSEMRLLRVTYTVEIDEESDEIVRIISAREANGLDKKDYERTRNRFD
jgi:uncharacterized DUF497 family protein